MKVRAMDPRGYPPQIEQRRMAPRTGTLEGRPVYLVDVRFDDSDRFMQQMANWFAEHMPSVRTVLRSKSGIHADDDPALFREIREAGGVLVLGVGH